MLEIEREERQGVWVMRPMGRMDTATCGQFESEAKALMGPGRARIAVDLSHLRYISSAGLRALLISAKHAKGLGGGLTLCRADGFVRDVIRVGGFDSVLGAHETVEAAIKALGG